MYVEEYNWF